MANIFKFFMKGNCKDDKNCKFLYDNELKMFGICREKIF